MSLTADGNDIMRNSYQYDAVDNILGISNTANLPSLFGNKEKLGGASSHTYQYDKLNRLISASGSAKDASYTLSMAYNAMSMPLSKQQNVENSTKAQSYHNYYSYEDGDHPSAPSQIGHEHYTYDANGNPVYGAVESHTWTPDGVFEYNNKQTSGYNIIKNYYTGAYSYEVANWLTKVNSLRLRTLSLTYDLPKKLLQKTRVIKRASFTATANNVLLFTNYDGDPEVAASGAGSGGSSSVGFDYLGTPATSSFTFGVNLTF